MIGQKQRKNLPNGRASRFKTQQGRFPIISLNQALLTPAVADFKLQAESAREDSPIRYATTSCAADTRLRVQPQHAHPSTPDSHKCRVCSGYLHGQCSCNFHSFICYLRTVANTAANTPDTSRHRYERVCWRWGFNVQEPALPYRFFFLRSSQDPPAGLWCGTRTVRACAPTYDNDNALAIDVVLQ